MSMPIKKTIHRMQRAPSKRLLVKKLFTRSCCKLYAPKQRYLDNFIIIHIKNRGQQCRARFAGAF